MNGFDSKLGTILTFLGGAAVGGTIGILLTKKYNDRIDNEADEDLDDLDDDDE